MNADAAARPRGRPRDPEVDGCIMAAAAEVFTDGGFEKFSVEAVAARAGVAKASIYRRFPSRVDLIVAMCQSFTPAVAPEIANGDIRADLLQLSEFLAGTLDTTTESGRLMPAMLSAAKEYPEVREAMAKFSASRRRRIYDIVSSAVERGELRSDTDPDVLGDLLVGAILYRILIRGARADKRFRTSVVDGVLEGFRA